MFQGSNNLTSGLPPEPIAEDQAVTFAEDEHRLLHDPEGAATPTRSATYGTLRGSADASTAPRDTNINTDTDTPRNKLNFGTVMYLCVLGIVTASGLVALFGCTRDASGPVSLQTDSNFPFATTSKHPLRPTPLWGNVEKPYPTGAWWLNLVMGDGDNPVAPLPYTFKATRYGVGVSYSAMRRTVSLTRVEDTYSTDLNVSVVEGVTGHHIVRYDDLTVTVQHDATDGGYFQTLAARGSPYMTFEFTGTTPRIKSHGKILELNGNEPKVGSSVYDTTLKLSLSNSETWLVFTSESVAWTVSSYSEIQAQTPFSGVVRVAMLPHSWDEDSETILKKHAHAFTRGGEVSITVTGDKMEMRYEWNKHGFDDLLMMALPHHMDILELGQGDGILLNNSYQTIKGPMTGIVGSVWIMTDTLTDIAWTARTPLAEAAKGIDDPLLTLSWEGQVKKALAADLNVVPSAPDIYGFGKECSRLARLALIADELGDVAARDAVVVSLNAVLVPWMKNNNENLLVYDKTWGGVVTNDGLNDVNADFGNAWYNDHTYHYGYVLYAVAVLAKFQPYFYSMHKKQIDFLVADVADDGKRAQKFFPKARQKDFYAGHSWTSGLFVQANGKSQESVSESINAYYAVYLLGMALGDDEMKDWGRVLLAMELRGARKYWQMPLDNGVYDSFFSSHRMVGVVASLAAVQLTWFGSNVEYVHCINMMPFTPITEELLPYDFMQQEWPVLETAFDGGDLGPQWAGYVSLAGAIVLPLDAWANVTGLSAFDSGNSLTNSLYWIATRGRRGSYNASDFTEVVEIQPQCEANSACNARGLVQHENCCPGSDGEMRGCCPSYVDGEEQGPAACATNPGCVALGITTGFCCPSFSGEQLACCTKPSAVGDGGESDDYKNVDPEALCSAHEGCSLLEGTCCPNDSGIFLSCCGAMRTPDTPDSNATSSPGKVKGDDDDVAEDNDAACARHDGCGNLGGDCCPTAAGDYLACCGTERTQANDVGAGAGNSSSGIDQEGGGNGIVDDGAACAGHEGCASLAGDCCPNQEGAYLACCSV